jgi:hypothetical protein
MPFDEKMLEDYIAEKLQEIDERPFDREKEGESRMRQRKKRFNYGKNTIILW